ncbi:lipopolysaccharide biosynthesis protein [Aerococcus urinae]
MNPYKKLFNNSIIFALGSLSSKIITMLLVPVYTYLLTTGEYGTIDLVTISVQILVPIVSLCMGEAILRFAIDVQNKTSLVTNVLLITTYGIIIFLLPLPLLLKFSKNSLLIFFTYILTVTQIFQTILSQYSRGLNRTKLFAVNGVLVTFLIAVFNIIFIAICDFGVNGYFLAMTLAYSVGAVHLIIALRNSLKINFKYIKKSFQIQLIRYSIPLIPNNLMWWSINASSRYIISYYLGVGHNGLFAVASKIPAVINLVTQVFTQAWQLSAIEEINKNSSKTFIKTIFHNYQSVLFVTFSFILIFLKPLFAFAFDINYFSAWEPVPFLLLSAVFSALAGFFGQIYVANKNTTGVFTSSLVSGFFNIISSFMLVPYLGLIGAGISSLLSFLILFLIRLWQINVTMDMNFSLRLFLCNSILALIQILALFCFDNGYLLFILQGLVFIALMIFNKSFFIKLMQIARNIYNSKKNPFI